MTSLDREEQELLDSYERDEWISDYTPERLKQLQTYADATLQTNKQETNLQKLLSVLKDGEWHSQNELVSKVTHRFGHTIFEARKKGYSVETRSVARNQFEYRIKVV